MIRAVLFDLDDTLVDHRDAFRAAVAGVREHHPALQSVPLDALVAENARILDELHPAIALGTLDVDLARIQRYVRLFAFAGAGGDAAVAARLHRALYYKHRRPIAGALELLVLLRAQVRIGVVTNNTRAEQTGKLAAFGLAPHVDTLVTSEGAGVAKPDPRIFALALERLDCAPGEAVMVGDSLVNDVDGARQAGIAAIWFDRAGAPLPPAVDVPVLRTLEPAAEVARRILEAGAGHSP